MEATCLSIAGSDPSGSAGIQADLRTFQELGVYGSGVVALLTAQNSLGIQQSKFVESEFVAAQLDSLLADTTPNAAKVGALGSRETVKLISNLAQDWQFPLIVDPIISSSNEQPLIEAEGVNVLFEELFPAAYLVTPNLREAELYTKTNVSSVDEMKKAAEQIAQSGCANVLITGGHLENETTDVLLSEGSFYLFSEPKHNLASGIRGTGCVLSAAITAFLAKDEQLLDAVHLAKSWISEMIISSKSFGKGANFFTLKKITG